MKKPQRVSLPAIPLAALLGLACTGLAHAQTGSDNMLVPTGTLTASLPHMYATKPLLTWEIKYPSKISDFATISPSGSITINNDDTRIWVKAIGSEISTGNPSLDDSSLNPEARISLNGSSYEQLFYGTQLDMHPSQVLYAKTLNKNDKIDFGGRYATQNDWGPLYTTRSANRQVIALKHGDTPPTSFQLQDSPMLASHLGPYFDESGKVNIGPFSMLILMELGQTDRNQYSFDYQDMALLVSFKKIDGNANQYYSSASLGNTSANRGNGSGNHGHGNNLDGVDSSNPGRGVGGPTGLKNSGQDPSGGIDDEKR
jgi:hypothetical protein